MRRSKIIPRVDSDSPLPRDVACVTWPTILLSRGTMRVPPESMSTAVFAVTGSPSFSFFESRDFASSAGITVPGAILTDSALAPCAGEDSGAVCASTTAEVSVSRSRSLDSENVICTSRFGNKKLYMRRRRTRGPSTGAPSHARARFAQMTGSSLFERCHAPSGAAMRQLAEAGEYLNNGPRDLYRTEIRIQRQS